MPATTAAKLLARMQDLSNQTPEKDFIGCFYGPSGAGKTTFVVDLAQQLRTDEGIILYLDSSDGWVSLENIEGLTDNVRRLQWDTLDDIMGIADAVKKRAKGFEHVEVIVIDELSSIVEDVLDQVVREDRGVKSTEFVEVEGKDYRPTQQLVMQALNRLHEIEGLHVVLVAHTREDVDHRKVVTTSPGFPPKLGKAIAKLMHVIGFLTAQVKGSGEKTTYVREVQLQPSALVSAKSRIGSTPFKLGVNATADFIAAWVSDEDRMAAELNEPEEQIEAQPDELPTDGIPVADTEDDEPDYAEEA